MLPDINALPTTNTGARDLQRIREITLQRIIEATAISRIGRAMITFTTPIGEAIDYKPGDLVDFHRPPATKDESGWKGPATVIENLPGSGQVKIRYKKGDILVKYPQARRFMDFTGLVFGVLWANTPHRQAFHVVTQFLNACPTNKLHTFGALQTSQGMRITQESKAQRRVAFALIFILENVFQIAQVTCVQIGRGVAKIPANKRGGSRTAVRY